MNKDKIFSFREMEFKGNDFVTVIMEGIEDWRVYPMDYQELANSTVYKTCPNSMEIRISSLAPNEGCNIFAICYASDIRVAQREIAACYLERHMKKKQEIEEELKKETIFVREIEAWQKTIIKESSRRKKETWYRVEFKNGDFVVNECEFDKVKNRATLSVHSVWSNDNALIVGDCIASRLNECKTYILNMLIEECEKKKREAKQASDSVIAGIDGNIGNYNAMKKALEETSNV